MITEKILDVFYGFISWLINLIPVFEMPAEFALGLKDTLQFVFWINNYIPVDTFLYCLGFLLTLFVGSFAVSAVMQLL